MEHTAEFMSFILMQTKLIHALLVGTILDFSFKLELYSRPHPLELRSNFIFCAYAQ